MFAFLKKIFKSSNSRPARGSQRVIQVGAGREYAGGVVNRLSYDWQPPTVTGDNAIRYYWRTMVDRARGLERENDYVRRWLSALENNVLGAEGINLQVKAMYSNGKFDVTANEKIEEAWHEWGKPEYCTVTQDESWEDVQRISLRSVARDGNIFIRKIRGSINGFGFSLQLLEADMLDINYSEILANGNEIRMGIEFSPYRKRIAYHFLRQHPGDYLFPIRNTDRDRVPADQVIHYFVRERSTQNIGVPWCCSAMQRLRHLEQYELAELIASRGASQKGGWFKNENAMMFTGDTQEVQEDSAGNKRTNELIETEPGIFQELPPGVSFIPYDPQHPNAPYGGYVESCMYGICAGLDADYTTLTGNLKNANYSSMRSGKLESQETYKKIQAHIIRKLCLPVFADWLLMAMTTRKVNLPLSKYENFNRPQFRGKRWPWVDPQKDVQAALEAVNGGLKTRTEIVAENGGDLEDVFNQLKQEQDLASAAGLNFANNKPKQQEPAQQAQDMETEEQDDSEEDEIGN